MKNKSTAHIENWRIVLGCLIGEVSNHPRQWYFQSRLQRTSPIIAKNIEEGWVETENTHYTLGKPFEE